MDRAKTLLCEALDADSIGLKEVIKNIEVGFTTNLIF